MQLSMIVGETGDGPPHVAEVIVAVATSRQRADALAAQAAASRHQSNGQTVYDAVYVRPLAADTLVDHDADVHVPPGVGGRGGRARSSTRDGPNRRSVASLISGRRAPP
jgi:hypothetical protein